MTDGMVTDNVDNLNQEEKMVPQSKMNEVVGREKLRIKQEMEQRHQQEIAAMQRQNGGIDEDAIAERAAAAAEQRLAKKMEEQQQKQQYVQYLDTVAGNYIEKMKAGPSLYEDFQETVADFDPKEFKDVLFLAHDLPELPDIVYELSKNTDKLTRLDALAAKSPKMAKREIQKLAQSIQANKAAKQSNESAPAPLKSIKPSTAAGVGDGKLGLRDLKKASWLRG